VKLFVSTADASGDLHAAALVEALRRRVPALDVYGLGGAALIGAGLEPVVEQSQLAVAGLVEVLGSAPRVVGAYAALRRELVARAPDACVFVDSPDLNLPLASVAHRAGIPSVYYVAPQVWAWRPGRMRKLRRRVDHVAVILPFEEALLRAQGVAATFVGHPLVERMERFRATLDAAAAARDLGVDRARPLLGLLPGSRTNEIDANLPIMVETAEILHEAIPELQVLLLLAPTLVERTPSVPGFVRVVRGRTHAAMVLATCLLAAPGTATTEAALLGAPMVVTHRVNRLTFAIAQRLVRVPSACMVNLIAGAGVVPERLQRFARPAALAGLVAHLLRDPEARAAMRRELAAACAKLGGAGAAERVATLVLEAAARS
jgi:lipid-A-disaccharide synthase